MPSVALGVPVLYRYGKLQALLESADRPFVDRVVVADDGPVPDRAEGVFDGSAYGFDLTRLELDSQGMGPKRAAIVEASSAEYLLMADSDHVLPGNADTWLDVLVADGDLGGVSGPLYEPVYDRIYCFAKDVELDRGALVFTSDYDRETRTVAGTPVVEFDYLPTPGLFRRECLADYAWDPEYTTGKDHADFYVGHYHETDWTFAVCPSVITRHEPGGDEEYMDRRKDEAELSRSEQYFREKWGVRDVHFEGDVWLDTNPKHDWTHRHRGSLRTRIARLLPSWVP